VKKLRVYLADDHPVVRNGLRVLLEAQPDMEVVGEAQDGAAAIRGVRDLLPDVVILDISMPGVGGAEATVCLHAECPEVRVVALTAYEDRGYLNRLLAAGAVGYILKRSAADELVQAIRQTAAGQRYLDPALAADVPHPGIRPHGSTAELSDREAQVLRLLAQGLLLKEIAARLDVSVKTIETYRGRAMEKLGLRSRADVVRHAVRQGWLTPD